jgi:hypothetical protein
MNASKSRARTLRVARAHAEREAAIRAVQSSGVPPLRAVRIARGFSLRATATAAGIHVAHLSRVERGMNHLSVDALYRLAGVLGLTELETLLRPYVHFDAAQEDSA